MRARAGAILAPVEDVPVPAGLRPGPGVGPGDPA